MPTKSSSKLKPSISDMIDQISTDVIWLEKRHGVIFPSGSAKPSPSRKSIPKVEYLRDAFVMDKQRQRKMIVEFARLAKLSPGKLKSLQTQELLADTHDGDRT